MSFDSRCYDLACVFLEDDTLPANVTTEAKKNELAQLIQTTIEDWIEYGDHGRPVPPHGSGP
jgi:hypothetical protein